jgi:hypothetical protein
MIMTYDDPVYKVGGKHQYTTLDTITLIEFPSIKIPKFLK